MGSVSYTVTCDGCGATLRLPRATSFHDARRIACERHGWELETRRAGDGWAYLDLCPACVEKRVVRRG